MVGDGRENFFAGHSRSRFRHFSSSEIVRAKFVMIADAAYVLNLKASRVIEPLDRLHQAHVAVADQVEEVLVRPQRTSWRSRRPIVGWRGLI